MVVDCEQWIQRCVELHVYVLESTQKFNFVCLKLDQCEGKLCCVGGGCVAITSAIKFRKYAQCGHKKKKRKMNKWKYYEIME